MTPCHIITPLSPFTNGVSCFCGCPDQEAAVNRPDVSRQRCFFALLPRARGAGAGRDGRLWRREGAWVPWEGRDGCRLISTPPWTWGWAGLALQGISDLRRATAGSKMKQENIFLFVPNLIGYARLIFAFIAFYFMPTSPSMASSFYLLSGFLDAFDGHAARALNQGTRFGAMLDMLTDRCATMCLLVNLAMLYPESALWFQLSMSLDVASHWLHLHSTVVKGGESHKSIDLTGNRILRVYYNSRPVLFIMCAGNELFYCMLYLLCFGEGPEILSGYVGLYRLILWVSTPIAITKSFISLIHLVSASCNMAALDAAERAKRK